MELVLGLTVLKTPKAVTFSGPPPQLAGAVLIFAMEVSRCAEISFRSICAKFLACITLFGLQ